MFPAKMDATPGKEIDVRTWLFSIDKSLVKYEKDLRALDFENTTCLKFLTRSDLDSFVVKPSEVHARMLLNGAAKLQTPRSKLGLDFNHPDSISSEGNLQPKKLDYNPPANEEKVEEFVYQSPTELMIGDLEGEIRLKRVELESARGYVDELKRKYCPTVSIDKTTSQCSKCHLRENPPHSRRRCPWGDCLGPENWSDLDRHPVEKKLLSDATTDVRSKEKEIEKLERERDSKRSAANQVQNSFKYKILGSLVNTNLEKYTFSTAKGRVLRQTVINNDVHILEKHYSGRVPTDLHHEKDKFQAIIDKFNAAHTPVGCKKKPVRNEVQKLLEERNVKFPRFQKEDVSLGSTTTSTGVSTSTSTNTSTAANPFFFMPTPVFATPPGDPPTRSRRIRRHVRVGELLTTESGTRITNLHNSQYDRN